MDETSFIDDIPVRIQGIIWGHQLLCLHSGKPVKQALTIGVMTVARCGGSGVKLQVTSDEPQTREKTRSLSTKGRGIGPTSRTTAKNQQLSFWSGQSALRSKLVGLLVVLKMKIMRIMFYCVYWEN